MQIKSRPQLGSTTKSIPFKIMPLYPDGVEVIVRSSHRKHSEALVERWFDHPLELACAESLGMGGSLGALGGLCARLKACLHHKRKSLLLSLLPHLP